MKLLRFLRRRSKYKVRRPNWRTAQRICAVIEAMLRADDEQYTIQEIAGIANQSPGSMDAVLAWMERLELAASYFEEPPLPGQPRRRLYFLTPKAYKWANEALLHGRAPDSDPTP